MEILTAIIVGFFTLFGVYIGSRIEWRSRHRAWLLEKRTEVFASFLDTLHGSLAQASGVFQDESLVDRRMERLQSIFYPMLDAAKKVRLFLVKEWREPFERHAIKISVAYLESIDNKEPVITNERKELERIIDEHIDKPRMFQNHLFDWQIEKIRHLMTTISNCIKKDRR